MKKRKVITCIIVFIGIIGVSLLAYYNDDINYEKLSKYFNSISTEGMVASANQVESEEVKKRDINDLLLTEFTMETVPASVIITEKNFSELSLDELNRVLYEGNLKMEYSNVYTTSSSRLTKSKGAQYFNGHRETYYSERVLPGNSLAIPGRHVGDDGTVRDGDGFICVAADPSYMAKGTILITSLGPAKVYDSGCAYGTIDIYVNW